jgi:type 1 glutamine amidotransferase
MRSLATKCSAAVLLAASVIGPARLSAQVDLAPLEQVRAALPARAPAKAAKQRTLLVFTLTKGYRHSSIPLGAEALKLMGERTGAYQTVVSDDPKLFSPEQIRRFDAICFLSTTGTPFEEPALRESLLDFVRRGGGVVGIHAATDCFYEWPQFGSMMGGYFDGHPWSANDTVTVKVEQPGDPLCKPFDTSTFSITDEIYQLKSPYSRDRLRILMSLDMANTDMTKAGIKRVDGDFAVSWVRSYGEGRVFYCSLGHREDIYWNRPVLAHYLAGIQFALGDLPTDTTPSGFSVDRGWACLSNGQDLSGWKGLVANPEKRAAMNPAELTEAQKKADERMRAHWSVKDGEIAFDGAPGENHLCTEKDYADFEMYVDWKIESGGDSGVYLRGSPQVQIWDPAQWPVGSGGLYNNQKNPANPVTVADNPIGQWNTFYIKMIGDRVTVRLNDTPVVDHAVLENYWDRSKPIYPTGQIELQSHGTKLRFRNIFIRELPPARIPPDEGWVDLLADSSLSGFTFKEGGWAIERGALARKKGGDIWTKERYDHFMLDVEFAVHPKGNSGVFFRTDDINDCVQTGIEMQVYDTYGKTEPGRGDCGAIYDCVAPRVQAVNSPGAWNRAFMICDRNRITVYLNGEEIVNMDLDQWVTPHANPDGSKNKFRIAYKDMVRDGHVGFQDHGDPVWYRNVRIKRLPR